MKHLLAILSVLGVIAFTATPTTANADCSRRIVSYTACGRPIYAVYQIYGYDRCGNPVGQWVTQSYHCSCSICNPRPVYNPPCDRGYGYGYPSHRSSGTWFGFGHGGSCGSPFKSGGFYFSFGR